MACFSALKATNQQGFDQFLCPSGSVDPGLVEPVWKERKNVTEQNKFLNGWVA